MRAASNHPLGDGLGVAREAARSPDFFTRAINLAARAIGGTAGAIAREFRGAAYTDISSLQNPSDVLLAAIGGLPTKSGATVSEETCFAVPTLAACINILSQSIAMPPVKIYRETAGGSEEAKDHPARQLLKRKAGGAQTSYMWRSYQMTCCGLGGNGYSRIYRDSYFRPIRIESLRASDVEPRIHSDGRMSYRIISTGEVLQDFEVIHFRGLTSNRYTGRAPIHDLRDSLGLAMVASDFAGSTFRNGNRQAGVITLPATTDKEKAELFKKFYQENYAGALNGGKTPIFTGGATWTDAGFSNQDAELLLTRKFSVEEIARAYRVPLTLLQSMEKTSSFGTGIAELTRGFVNFTLMPWAINWEQELEDKLLTEQEKAEDYSIRFDFTQLLRGSPQEQATFWQTMWQLGAATANEVRRAMHMVELPDTGANNTFVPVNYQPAALAANPKEPAPALGGE